jgi:hypothetical protein
LLAHGRWFSLGTPASSTTKTGHHDIAEILLKVELNTINQSINQSEYSGYSKKLQCKKTPTTISLILLSKTVIDFSSGPVTHGQ